MKEENDSYWGGIVKAMGLVFGDIGTSPIYTLTVIFTLTKLSRKSIYGTISPIVQTGYPQHSRNHHLYKIFTLIMLILTPNLCEMV